VRATLQKPDVLEGKALQAAEAKLESGEIEEERRRELQSGRLAVSSPESAESPPARSS